MTGIEPRPGSRTNAGRTAALTVAALVAFAANSVLCRLALGSAAIDAASFTTLRLASGALALVALAAAMHPPRPVAARGSWAAAAALFGYAIAFSFAYLSLSAGTGALILFGAVQLTLILAGLRAGKRPRAPEWIGLACAAGASPISCSPG